jgi:hypothetical protein
VSSSGGINAILFDWLMLISNRLLRQYLSGEYQRIKVEAGQRKVFFEDTSYKEHKVSPADVPPLEGLSALSSCRKLACTIHSGLRPG